METRDVATVLSVTEAKARLDELLDAAVANPVEIASEDGRTAYLVSKQDFNAMVASVEELTDQLWLARAELARKGGFVGSAEMKEILVQLEDVAHAEADTRERG
jgi:prevent-host-death family protein